LDRLAATDIVVVGGGWYAILLARRERVVEGVDVSVDVDGETKLRSSELLAGARQGLGQSHVIWVAKRTPAENQGRNRMMNERKAVYSRFWISFSRINTDVIYARGSDKMSEFSTWAA
jgi:hypothetical protein